MNAREIFALTKREIDKSPVNNIINDFKATSLNVDLSDKHLKKYKKINAKRMGYQINLKEKRFEHKLPMIKLKEKQSNLESNKSKDVKLKNKSKTFENLPKIFSNSNTGEQNLTKTSNDNRNNLYKTNTNVYLWYYKIKLPEEHKNNKPKDEELPKIHQPEQYQIYNEYKVGYEHFADNDEQSYFNIDDEGEDEMQQKKTKKKKKKKKLKSNSPAPKFVYNFGIEDELEEPKEDIPVPVFVPKKGTLTVEELKTMSLSNKFMRDARKMIFIPETNSFEPKNVYNNNNSIYLN